ncbi:MAG: hypothetical protein WAW96_05670 [Alphaproteobacteria bacterium]
MTARAARFVCAALIAALFNPALAHAFTASNVCAAVRASDIATVLGETPPTPISSGPAADDDHPAAIATSCRYEGKVRVFAMMLLDFKTVSEGVAALKHDIDAVKAAGDAKIAPVQSSGLGEDVYLATDQSSATYISRKGPRLIAIGVAGETAAVPNLPAVLLKIAQSAVSRLPPPMAKPEPSAN